MSLLFDSEFFVFDNTVKKLMLCNYNVLSLYRWNEIYLPRQFSTRVTIHLSKFRINIRIVGSSISFQLFTSDNPIRSHSQIQRARIKYQAMMMALVFSFFIHCPAVFALIARTCVFLDAPDNTHAKYIYVHILKSWHAHIRMSVTRSNCVKIAPPHIGN